MYIAKKCIKLSFICGIYEQGEMMGTDSYSGCNPPPKWKKNHPRWVICNQCSNSFVNMKALNKHFEKEGGTCKRNVIHGEDTDELRDITETA